MPVIFPKKLVISSKKTQAQFLTALNERLYIPKEKGIFKVNKFIKANYFAEVFYGSVRENAFTIQYHRPRKYDGGGVRFNGVAVKTNNGLVITGYLRQPISAYIAAILQTLLLLLAGMVLFVENPLYGLLCLALIFIFNGIIFSGRKNAREIEAFLRELAGEAVTEKNEKNENSENGETTEKEE